MLTRAIGALFFIVLLGNRLALADEISLLEKGMEHYYQRSWDQAIPAFREALTQNPQHSLALTFYLIAHLQKGSLEKAVEEIEDKLIDNPRDTIMQAYLGYAMYTRSFKKGRQARDDAMRELRTAALQQPLALVHTGLGILYQDRGQLSRARKEFLRALELNNKDLLAMEYLGQLYLYDEKKPDDAVRLFNRILEITPSYPDPHYYLARALEEKGRTDEAIKHYRRTMELDPNGVGRGFVAPANLGDLYLRQKDYGMAANLFRTAIKLNPRSELLKKKLERAEKGPAGEPKEAKNKEKGK